MTSSRPTVAIIRGWYLSKWEMMRYEPLRNEFDIRAIGANCPLYDLSDIKLNITKLHWPGECIYALGKTPAQLINRGLYKYLRYNEWLFGLERAVKKCDILHAVDTAHLFSLQAVRIKQKYGNKVVLTVWENIPYQDQKRKIYRPISDEVIRYTDKFLPVTDRSKEMLILEGVPKEKIAVIPQPVDLDKFKPQPKNESLRNTFGCSNETPLILCIARLHRSKGIEFLLAALKMLHRSPGASLPKLVMIGSGEREGALKSIAMRLGIANHVIWCGGIHHHELPQYYAASDIFVLPSIPTEEWQEQFGMVLIEAMACGKPIVSTLSGSIPNVVGDAGILVQPADFTALYESLRLLIARPLLRNEYGQKARARAESEYHPDKIAEQTSAIYKSLLT